MTAVAEIRMVCDFCRKSLSTDKPTIPAARAVAVGGNWRRQNSIDICAECWDSGVRNEGPARR